MYTCKYVAFQCDPPTVRCADIGTTVQVELTVTDASGNSNSCLADLDVLASPPSPICDTITVQLDAIRSSHLMGELDALGAQFIDMCTTTPPICFKPNEL
ncbi:MAG: hypothetical protein R2784_10490 [Saprospiraceae bacterium]